jgi:hypothetical protein
MRNYAKQRSKKPDIVFFNYSDVPSFVAKYPKLWSVWFPVDGFHTIGVTPKRDDERRAD